MRKLKLFALLTLFLSLNFAFPALAAVPNVSMSMGTTTVFTAPDGVTRIAIGDQSIADIITPPGQNREILITAKKQGFTNFIVWLVKGPARQYFLEVLPPGRRESILVRIRVLEVAQGSMSKLGFNLNDTVQIGEAPPTSAFRFGLPVRESYLSSTINLLAQENKAKILAEPTLLCANNASASFLSGGEFPIPLIARDSVNIEWKRFGVQLNFQPTVQETDTIIMRLRPEVSSLDTQNGIELPTVKVPGVATRFAETTVTLQSGQSIVIAGLKRSENTKTAYKVPFLGELPVVGEFFRTTKNESKDSELVFIVSPTLMTNTSVKPEEEYGERMK